MAKAKKINPKEIRYAEQAVKISNGKVRILNEVKELKSIKMTPEVKTELYDYVFGNGENPFAEIQAEAERQIQVYDDEFNMILSEIERGK